MPAVSVDHPAQVLRPFVLIGGVAFSTGFLGYMALWNFALV